MGTGKKRYAETIEFLYSQLPAFERDGASAYKPGLDRARALESTFANPHTSFPAIHIAGTNGKGSTAHTLAAILQSAGYRTGLFTSPHLLDFRERIKVDGEMIPEGEVIDFVERFKNAGLEIAPSFFELTTTMAFEHFRKRRVDIAVIETGLGGRLDSTNIISPILSVITNISLDHTGLLGDTRALIAAEKAGIIKPYTPVVIGESDDEVRPVFESKASELSAPIIFTEEEQPVKSYRIVDGKPHYVTEKYGEIVGELRGDYQLSNAATILTAVGVLRKLGYDITSDAVKTGFEQVCELTGLMGRWMKIGNNPVVICDTGHNAGGWRYLAPQIDGLPGKKHIVIGFVDDKDVRGILKMIATDVTDCRLYFTQPSNHRALPAETVREIASEVGLDGEVFTSVDSAYKKALADAGKGDSVYVGGSSYVVADFLTYLREITSLR